MPWIFFAPSYPDGSIEAPLFRRFSRSGCRRWRGSASELDLKCRKVKHDYFNSAAGKGLEVYQSIRLDGGLTVEAVLDDPIMTALLAKPIPSLGNLSWPAAFEQRLAGARDVHGVRPDFVIVTGGAARMGFVVDLIAKSFPTAQVARGKEPEHAIAKGLALFGRAAGRSQAFHVDVDAMVRGPAVEQLVTTELPRLQSSIAGGLSRAIVTNVVRAELLAWRDGRTPTLRQMENRIEDGVRSFAASAMARRAVEDATKAWFDDIRPELHRLTDPICESHGQPKGSLDVAPDMHFSTKAATVGPVDVGLSGIGTLISAITATVVGMIMGGAGVSLMALPLIGQIIVGVGAFFAFFYGTETLVDRVKDMNLPVPMCQLMTDASIESNVDEANFKLTAGLLEELQRVEDKAPADEKLANRIARHIDLALRQRADDAILRFG